jgi:integrase
MNVSRPNRIKGQGSVYRRGGKGPYYMAYRDHLGVKRESSCRTTDKRTAIRILDRRINEIALIREGIHSPSVLGVAKAAQEPIGDHIRAYEAHCKLDKQAPRAIDQKVRHLAAWVGHAKAKGLPSLTAASLEAFLDAQMVSGKSARTLNTYRQSGQSFISWAVKTGRLHGAAAGPFKAVPKQNEALDPRHSRRALTPDELSRLMSVASSRGRHAWYAGAYYAGLRKGDLLSIRYSDLVFDSGDGGHIIIRRGKSGRRESIPLHPALRKILQERKAAEYAGDPDQRVFPHEVTNRTRQKDFEAAGIPLRDEQGNYADLHALRKTLATSLSDHGAPLAQVQSILRHADITTTADHYLDRDTARTDRALRLLPSIEYPQSISQLTRDETAQFGASGCEGLASRPASSLPGASVTINENCWLFASPVHGGAGGGVAMRKAGDGTRTRDIQLGKLTLYQLSYTREIWLDTIPRARQARSRRPSGTPPPRA